MLEDVIPMIFGHLISLPAISLKLIVGFMVNQTSSKFDRSFLPKKRFYSLKKKYYENWMLLKVPIG